MVEKILTKMDEIVDANYKINPNKIHNKMQDLIGLLIIFESNLNDESKKNFNILLKTLLQSYNDGDFQLLSDIIYFDIIPFVKKQGVENEK